MNRRFAQASELAVGPRTVIGMLGQPFMSSKKPALVVDLQQRAPTLLAPKTNFCYPPGYWFVSSASLLAVKKSVSGQGED
jgi:hypothetical protein